MKDKIDAVFGDRAGINDQTQKLFKLFEDHIDSVVEASNRRLLIEHQEMFNVIRSLAGNVRFRESNPLLAKVLDQLIKEIQKNKK